jgi:hypothetical protein
VEDDPTIQSSRMGRREGVVEEEWDWDRGGRECRHELDTLWFSQGQLFVQRTLTESLSTASKQLESSSNRDSMGSIVDRISEAEGGRDRPRNGTVGEDQISEASVRWGEYDDVSCK